MKAKLLGTGPSEGVPAPMCSCKYCEKNHRRRPSLFISGDVNILFDASPDIKMQLRSNSINSIDAVVITHTHFDHSSGLRELYNTCVDYDGIEQDLKRPVHKNLRKRFELFLSPLAYDILQRESGYIFDKRESFIVNQVESVFEYGEFTIEPFSTDHSDDYLGYVIEKNGEKIVYNPDNGKLESEVKFDYVDALVQDFSPFLYSKHGSTEIMLDFIENVDPDSVYFTNVSEHVAQSSTQEIKSAFERESWNIVEDDAYVISGSSEDH